ncbi:TraA family conjugative transfer protein [Photobacterium ganghwense]|uniref:TraA family conjugative transfer protein n=1 Tax=Photobacterium ganghwense TaxID=320778 RepID=UPI001A8EBF9F|nr:TrbC/VirB2 family protein [Photobacterium ganghwense]
MQNLVNDIKNAAKNKDTLRNLSFMFVLALLMLASRDAMAGNAGTEFDDVWTTLKDWTQGSLGRIVAGSMILVGLVGGIARQNIMAFATGIGGGMGLYNSPKIVETVMGATLETAEKVLPVVTQITNGLN